MLRAQRSRTRPRHIARRRRLENRRVGGLGTSGAAATCNLARTREVHGSDIEQFAVPNADVGEYGRPNTIRRREPIALRQERLVTGHRAVVCRRDHACTAWPVDALSLLSPRKPTRPLPSARKRVHGRAPSKGPCCIPCGFRSSSASPARRFPPGCAGPPIALRPCA